MNTLAINFNAPSVAPGNGYLTYYRPKGTTMAYYAAAQATGSPIKITAGILANVDYEGTIQSVCSGSSSAARSFTTSNFSNAVGNITIPVCAVAATPGAISTVSFNGSALLPLGQSFPIAQGQSSGFVSNVKGVFSLTVTHSFLAGTMTVTDSLGATYTQTITTSPNIFPLLTITEVLPFSLKVTC